jgi:hypothetical protein
MTLAYLLILDSHRWLVLQYANLHNPPFAFAAPGKFHTGGQQAIRQKS